MESYPGGQGAHLQAPNPNGFQSPANLRTMDHPVNASIGPSGSQWPANGQGQGIGPAPTASLANASQQPINNTYTPSVGQLVHPAGRATYTPVYPSTQPRIGTDANVQTQNVIRMGLAQYPPMREETPTFGASSYVQHYNQGIGDGSAEHATPQISMVHTMTSQAEAFTSSRTGDEEVQATARRGQDPGTETRASTPATGRKRRRHPDDVSSEDEEESEIVQRKVPKEDVFRKYGAIFCRLGGVFTHAVEFIKAGVSWELDRQAGTSRSNLDLSMASQPKMDSPEVQNIESTKERHLIESWILTCGIIPDFRRQMVERTIQRRSIYPICQKFNTCILDTRSSDTGILKKHGFEYVKKDHTKLDPELVGPDASDKTKRAWKHFQLAILLMPVKYDPTPEVVALLKVNDKNYPVTHKHLPRFLYPEGHKLVPGNEEDGLFEGHFIIYVWQHIYTGPSAVYKKKGKAARKGCNAERIGIRALGPRSAAYGCIQARHFLNAQPEWDQIDGNFDAAKFYWSIVAILENGDEGKAHLDKINRSVFGDTPQGYLEIEDDDEELPEDRILRQRRERAALVS